MRGEREGGVTKKVRAQRREGWMERRQSWNHRRKGGGEERERGERVGYHAE